MKKFLAFLTLLSILLLLTLPALAATTPAQKKVTAPSPTTSSAMQSALALNQKSATAAASTVISDTSDDAPSAADINQKIKSAQTEYNNQLEQYKTRLRAMFENSDGSYIQELIKSKNLFDFYQRLEVLQLIAKQQKDMLRQLEFQQNDLQNNQKLSQEMSRVNLNLASRSSNQSQIDMEQNTIALIETQENAIITQSNELTGMIRKLQGTDPYTGGTMRWPIPGFFTITSPYGMRFHPILKKMEMHTGVDIGAPIGTSWVAANNGKVVLAEYLTGYGNTLIIDHGGKITTLSAHMSKFVVKKGDTVVAGQTIGKVGMTGWTTGPHGHFEVRKDGETCNPTGFISPQ